MAIRVTAALLVACLYFTITVAALVNDEGLTPPAINGELYTVEDPGTEVNPMQETCVNPFNVTIPATMTHVIVRTCQVTDNSCGRISAIADGLDGDITTLVEVCKQGSGESLAHAN